jgi:hypothetical protein
MPMKALMNGCLILGSRQTSNNHLEKIYYKTKEPKILEYELKEEIEETPIILFGSSADKLKLF